MLKNGLSVNNFKKWYNVTLHYLRYLMSVLPVFFQLVRAPFLWAARVLSFALITITPLQENKNLENWKVFFFLNTTIVKGFLCVSDLEFSHATAVFWHVTLTMTGETTIVALALAFEEVVW